MKSEQIKNTLDNKKISGFDLYIFDKDTDRGQRFK